MKGQAFITFKSTEDAQTALVGETIFMLKALSVKLSPCKGCVVVLTMSSVCHVDIAGGKSRLLAARQATHRAVREANSAGLWLMAREAVQ